MLDVVPTVARTGLATAARRPQGRRAERLKREQFVRDIEQMPAQLDRAAQLKSLGSRPLGVVTAGTGSQPGWTQHQNDLATLSSHSFHRTVAGSTHQSLIDDPTARRGLQPRHPRRRHRGTQQEGEGEVGHRRTCQ